MPWTISKTLPCGRLHPYSGTVIARATWETLLARRRGLLVTGPSTLLHALCLICAFMGYVLTAYGVSVSIFLAQSRFHPCDASSSKDFARSYQCKHSMSFCKVCKELYSVDKKGNCPWHAYLKLTHFDGGACAVPGSTVANLSSAQLII